MQAKDVIDQAARLLADKSNDEWPRKDLAQALSFVLRQIALLRPDAMTRPATLKLDPGYEQTVPDGVVRWMGAIRNMGSDGATPGRAIRNADRQSAEDLDPLIGESRPGAVVREVYASPGQPRQFFTYPPVTSKSAVHIQYWAVSEPPTGGAIEQDETTELPVTDEYGALVVDGVVGYALATYPGRNNERPPDGSAWQRFLQTLGAGGQSDRSDSR